MPDSYFEQNITNIAEVQQWARENLFQLLEELSEGTVIVDADSRVVWMNERYAGRFGPPGARQSVWPPLPPPAHDGWGARM